MERQIDMLHPLATLDWTECTELPVNPRRIHCVSLEDKIYVYQYPSLCAKLYVSSTDLKSWTVLSTPSYESALSTYNSQLVLISGKDVSSKMPTNKVWSSGVGINWQESLPPLPRHHNSPRAVNTGNPEYLVVVSSTTIPFKLDVLMGEKWSTVSEPLSRHLKTQGITVHAGKLYFISPYSACYCHLQSLVQSCTQPEKQHNSHHLWNSLLMPIADKICSVVSIQGQLLCLCNCKIYAYSHLARGWVHVAEPPRYYAVSSSLVLPSDRLVVSLSDYKSPNTYKASLIVPPYMTQTAR